MRDVLTTRAMNDTSVAAAGDGFNSSNGNFFVKLLEFLILLLCQMIAVILEYTIVHPILALLQLLSALLMAIPEAMFSFMLGLLGFTATGPAAGSFAAWVQSMFGVVPTRGWFATFQSAAMGGFGRVMIAIVPLAGFVMFASAIMFLVMLG